MLSAGTSSTTAGNLLQVPTCFCKLLAALVLCTMCYSMLAQGCWTSNIAGTTGAMHQQVHSAGCFAPSTFGACTSSRAAVEGTERCNIVAAMLLQGACTCTYGAWSNTMLAHSSTGAMHQQVPSHWPLARARSKAAVDAPKVQERCRKRCIKR